MALKKIEEGKGLNLSSNFDSKERVIKIVLFSEE